MKSTILKTGISLIGLLAFQFNILNAQYASVVYDPERSMLNEGQPLPAESFIMMSGPVADRIAIVEARIYDHASLDRTVYTNRWERSEWNADRRFLIPIDHKLKGSDKYTIVLAFFEPLPGDVPNAMAEVITGQLSAYVDENVEIMRGKTKLLKPASQMLEELNAQVTQGLSNYRTRLDLPFAGFSQLVEDKLRKLNETKLNLAKFSIKRSEEDDQRDQKIDYARNEIEGLKQVIRAEIMAYLDREQMIVRDRAVFKDIETEKVKNIIALNLGYGGIYNSGGTEDLSYGQAPFLGLSIPLGRVALTSRILSNSSLSAGLFLNNVENEAGETVTGPLIGRPLYLAYGYRIFKMVRLNIGGALLQKDQINIDGSDSSTIYGRPFIGASLEIDLWLGIGQ